MNEVCSILVASLLSPILSHRGLTFISGTAMALFSLGILVGPIVGPVAGAWLVADASWRWAIWLIVIAAGVVSLASFGACP